MPKRYLPEFRGRVLDLVKSGGTLTEDNVDAQGDRGDLAVEPPTGRARLWITLPGEDIAPSSQGTEPVTFPGRFRVSTDVRGASGGGSE